MLGVESNSSQGALGAFGNQQPTQLVVEDELQERRAMFRDFLTSRDDWGEGRNYPMLIREMLKTHRTRLTVNINDLRQFNRALANL
jgi:hypothetical protein